MAKTIKFNLVCDGHQVRTLEDLRNNFNIDDILQYYRDKVLEKWLTVRGYTDELNHVKKINGGSPTEIISKLVAIFKVETDKDKIHYATSVIQYREDRMLADKSKIDSNKESEAIYDAYFHKYEQLKEDILRNPTDKVKILAILNEIGDQYAWIFSHDYRNFFYYIKETSPLAVLCLLMNQFTRKYYIFDGDFPSDSSNILISDVKEMYNILNDYFSNEVNLDQIEAVIKKAEDTKSYYVPVSQNECMIILMKEKCMISENKNDAGLLSSSELRGKFKILNGLVYRSSQSYCNELYYIEI